MIADDEGTGGDVGEAPSGPAASEGSPEPSTSARTAARARRRPARADASGDVDRQGDRVDPRVQRTVRLSREIDAMIRALAQHRGIDLNAAISVAIAGDFDRVFGPPPRPPDLLRERDEPASTTTSPPRDR